jgi:hypothetical protein
VQLILKIAIVQFSTFQAWDIVMLLASIWVVKVQSNLGEKMVWFLNVLILNVDYVYHFVKDYQLQIFLSFFQGRVFSNVKLVVCHDVQEFFLQK